jgi:hypothetical protein
MIARSLGTIWLGCQLENNLIVTISDNMKRKCANGVGLGLLGRMERLLGVP